MEVKLNQTEIKNLDWNVNDGTLNMRLKPGGGPNASGEVTIYYTKLDDLKVSGANVVVDSLFDGQMLDVDLQAGAVLSMNVDLLDLYLKVAGNSAVNLTGKVKYYTLVAGARSKADTRQLVAQDVRVEAASGAEVYVCAEERLQIKAATGASVFYRGEPEILRTSSRMMATLNSIGK